MRLLLAALVAAVVATAQPISLHPDNPHYFLYRGKPTVLITSGEHYGAVLNLDFEYNRYLYTLARNRLNLTRVFSGTYREVPGNFAIAANTLAPAPGRFISPWAQMGRKFDLTRYDEGYFTRLKGFLREAERRGVIVEFNLFCPLYEDSMWSVSPMNARNNLNGIGDVPRTDVLALKDARLTEVQIALVGKIVTELREFDNLYYEICNEPYFGGVTAEFQRKIAETIAGVESTGKKHMIAWNWANGSSVVDAPDALVSLYNFHYSRPPDSIGVNRALNRAIGNNETGFDGGGDATYRIQGWDFLVAGGALYNNLDYSFAVAREDGSFMPDAKTPGGGSATLRRQLEHLRRFFDSIPFVRMTPVEGAVEAPEGASARALGEPGRVYVVYVHHGRPVKGKPYEVDRTAASRKLTLRLPAGRYAAEWRDPKSGRTLRRETVEIAPGGTTLASPVYAEDVALLLTRRP